jgi:hypothetical protein
MTVKVFFVKHRSSVNQKIIGGSCLSSVHQKMKITLNVFLTKYIISLSLGFPVSTRVVPLFRAVFRGAVSQYPSFHDPSLWMGFFRGLA